MEKDPKFVICPKCGKKFVGTNLFGKLCIKCGYYISPTDGFELPIVSDNKKKDKEFLEKFRECVRKYFLEIKYGNKNR